MKTETTQCLTCGSKVAGTPLGALCLACVLRASRTPVADPHGAITTWAEVFPQLEVERTLRESEGYSIYLARVIGDQDRAAGKAVLQVVSGAPLERAGGAATLQTRAQRLAGQDSSGLASILDFGDLADAFFLVTEAPAQPTVPEILTGLPTDELAATLSALTTEAEAIIQRADVPVRFDPEISFADPDTAQLTLTPNLLAECSEPESATVEITSLEAGRRLGPFVLVEEAGEGGFGEVWRARQEQPVEREVALKILKGGLHSQRARARFEVEQQALAKLEHPHIARFFDGGTTPAGRPFFAMEWIDGQSLTRHCEKTTTPLQERLRLFAQVCEAVHHAHQKGIIHRDLKPSNVMVTANGQPSSVKVIDFGIARALEHPETDQTQLTRAEEILGTPASMSPEQVAGSGMTELDARTDVYGLGILLYELLTGKPPFDPKLPPDELRRCIREDDPRTPSARAEDPVQARQLRGDLDWIVMRCLEKDPSRRYSSVSVLLRDLERHSQDEPVEAGPPEFSYRTRKFVRRNKVPVLAGAVVVLALVLATVISLLQMRRAEGESTAAREAEGIAEERRVQAEAEKETATIASTFLSNLLQSPDPKQRGPEIKVIDLLEDATLNLRADSAMQPVHKALLLRTLGNTHRSLGRFPEAVELLEESFALYQATVGPLEDPMEDVLHDLVQSCWQTGQFEKATIVLREHCLQLSQALDPSHADVIEAKAWLASSYQREGEFQKAVSLLEELEKAAERSEDTELAQDVRWELASAYSDVGKSDQGIAICLELLPKFAAREGLNSEDYRDKVASLAIMLRDANRNPEAVAILQEALDHHLSQAEQDVHWILLAKDYLAISLHRSGRREEAVVLGKEVLELIREVYGPEHPKTLTTIQNLALLNVLGTQRSMDLLAEVIAIQNRIYHPAHRKAITTKINYLAKLFDRDRIEEAKAVCRELTKIFAPDDDPDSLTTTGDGEPEPSSRARGTKSIPEVKNSAVLPPGMTVPAGSIEVIVQKLVQRDEYDLAIPFAEIKAAIQRERLGDDHEQTGIAYHNLGYYYSEAGRHQDALQLARKATESFTKIYEPDSWERLNALNNLAIKYREAGDRSTALVILEECLIRGMRSLRKDDQVTLHTLRYPFASS